MRNPLELIANRSPVPLTSTRAYSDGFMTLFRRRNTGEQALQAYGENGILFPIVSRLASATSKADWTLYRKAKSGLKEDRTPVAVHACIDLWEKPNPFMHRRRFMEYTQQHVDLVGESATIAAHQQIGSALVPIELWPVKPTQIMPVKDPYAFIAGYIYTSPDGQRVPLEVNELSRMLMPDPDDPYRGLGAVQTVLRDLDSAKYSTEWNAKFFENSAQPGGVIETEEELSDIAFRRLQSQWNVEHKGVSKAHRVAILEGAKWVSTSISQRDMQFAELANISDEKIRKAFGYPKPMLGDVDNVNRANAEAGEYVFSKWLIEDRLDRWRDWLNFDILPQFGSTAKGLEWDYESPVPANSEARNAALTAEGNVIDKLIQRGYDSTELLAFLGWPDIPRVEPSVPAPAVFPGEIVPANVMDMLTELAQTHPGAAQDALTALLRKQIGSGHGA